MVVVVRVVVVVVVVVVDIVFVVFAVVVVVVLVLTRRVVGNKNRSRNVGNSKSRNFDNKVVVGLVL